MSTFQIREGTVQDAALVCHHRRCMLRDMGHSDGARLDAMVAVFRPWVEARLASREYLAWFVQDGSGTVVAGAGVWLMPWPAAVAAPDQPRANILNVYTEPSHRRSGHARRLLVTILDWCRNAGIETVILHASEQGRPLYESLGFGSTNEMRLKLRGAGLPSGA
jgi:GNAT superfamily N-acetyltransferase